MGEINQFVSRVIPSFNNVYWKETNNKVPQLVILDNKSNEIERISLINKTLEECTNILLEKGFRYETSKRFRGRDRKRTSSSINH